MNNNDNKQSVGSSVGSAVGGAAKMGMSQLGALIKKKLLLLLAPALPYILLGVFLFLAIIIVFSNFNSIFSLITGRDPLLTETNEGEYEDLNGEIKFSGQEQADKLLDSYTNPGSGLGELEECDPDRNLWEWISEKFTGRFANVCSLIIYIQKTANNLEDKYDFETGEIDRGLVISTLLYAYVYRNDDVEGEPDPDDPILSSGDPLTVFNYMVENEPDKIKKADIELMFKRQIFSKKYVRLTWGVVRTVTVYKEGTDEIDYIEKYYGCNSEVVTGQEIDFDKYKLFLRDDRVEIIGKDETIGEKVTAKAVLPEMEINGYIGAKNFYYSYTTSTSYCLGGEPNLDPANHEYLETENGSNYVTMGVAQAFIKNIVDNKLYDYEAFLTKADYESISKDNLSFTYAGNSYKIDYSEGFLNEKFTYMEGETNESAKSKKGEKIIDVIFNNSSHMNDSLNFPYVSAKESIPINSVAVVVGDEANPLGDFPYKISSNFGMRGAIAGTTHTSENYHGAIDMAGSGIEGTGVYAWKDGTVLSAGFDYKTGCGNFVKISHTAVDGKSVTSLYCHMLKTPLVEAGQEVTAGTLIGQVGNTGNSSGPHLHFAISVNGTAVDPCNYITVGRTCAEARGE